MHTCAHVQGCMEVPVRPLRDPLDLTRTGLWLDGGTQRSAKVALGAAAVPAALLLVGAASYLPDWQHDT